MTRRSTAAILVSVMLAGCSQVNVPQQAAPASAYDRVTTVTLTPTDTRQSIEQALGGRVLAWMDAGCAGHRSPCSAIVGLPTQLGSQSLALRRSEREGRARTEHNRKRVLGAGQLATMKAAVGVWATAAVGVWATAAVGVWATAAVGVWATGNPYWNDGQYALLPENTATWQKINLQSAQDLTPHLGSGVTVAVIDTGIDVNHIAFSGMLTDPSTWYDFVQNDPNPQEEGTLGVGGYGHGSGVAGIIAQVAPGVKLMPIRVLDATGGGDIAAVAQGIIWAVDHGAQVINLSLGTGENSPAVEAAVAYATSHGVVTVAAAGNENLDELIYPAALARTAGTGDDLISVGSSDLADHKSAFSNYAPQLEILAPGEHIAAPAPEGRVASWSGTSMAAPVVTGALALVLGEQNVPASTLAGALTAQAHDLSLDPVNEPYQGKLGEGRLDVARLVQNTLQH